MMVGYDPKQRQLSSIEYSIAGASSGVFTRGISQPLDVLKIRLQLQVEPIARTSGSKYHGMLQASGDILREEGIKAFWKGHVPAQGLSIIYGTVQFSSFEMLTKVVWVALPSYFSTELQPFTHFVCGGLAGCLATVAGQPLDVIRTRFVAQGEPKIYLSVRQAAGSILKREGVYGLYRGLSPALLQIAPQAGFQFGFYSLFNKIWCFVLKDEHSSVRSLLCGAAAGLCAKLSIYPLDMAKKRLQVQGFEKGRSKFGRTDRYDGLIDCMRTVTRNEGMRGLYKGLSPSLVKAVVTVASHFWTYDMCCHLLSTKKVR